MNTCQLNCIQCQCNCSWLQKSDVWALHVGTLLTPWGRNGVCVFTTWDGLQSARQKWLDDVDSESYRYWSNHIHRDRNMSDDSCVIGDDDKLSRESEPPFPNPVWTWCLDFEDNLANNLRVPEQGSGQRLEVRNLR